MWFRWLGVRVPSSTPSSGSRTGPREGVARDRLLGQRRAPSGIRPALRAGNRNFLARLRRAAASSDWSLLSCERGSFPPFTLSPEHAGSERSSLPDLSSRVQPSAARAHGMQAREHRPPVGTAGRSTGKAVTRERLKSCAPLLNRPALRAGHRNSLARLRRAAASSDGSLLFCERGESPLSHFPPNTRAANRVRCHLFSRVQPSAARAHGMQARERRPPAGTAPRSGAKLRIADSEESRGRLGTPTSGRHSGPKARDGRDPNRREGSLLGAYPSRAGWRATAGPHRENWPLASGRHRAGARNLR